MWQNPYPWPRVRVFVRIEILVPVPIPVTKTRGKPAGTAVPVQFTISSTGIFRRSIYWCTCPNAPERHIQLLRARLFPATFINPKTAFTFKVLDHFRLDALECRTSAMNFMNKLCRKTNEIFLGSVPVCVTTLIRFHL
jgi:hypothetical protein